MTDEITEVATDNIDTFFSKLNEAADVVTEKLVDVAPEATEAILNLIQFKGVFNLVLGGVFFLMLVATICTIFTAKVDDDYDPASFRDGVKIYGGMIVAFPLFIATLEVGFLSFYNWLSAFYPEGALALKALEAVGITL